MKIKRIITLLLFFVLGNVFAQQKIEITLQKFKIKNKLFKSNLKSILVEEEKQVAGKEFLFNELHLIIIKKRTKSDIFDITIIRGNNNDILYNTITLSSIGYLYIKGNLFIIKGECPEEIFNEVKHNKTFLINQSNDLKIPIIDDSFEWNYTFINGCFL